MANTQQLAKSKDSIVWVREFTLEAVQQFHAEFMKLEGDPEVAIIPVVICSYGGDVFALLAMRDLIKSSSKIVATIGMGTAMSCGAVLLASGTKGFRFCTPGTHVMVHEVSSWEHGKTNDMKFGVEFLDNLNRQFLEYLAEDSGRKLQEFDRKLVDRKNADWYLTAQEAKEWGLVDHVDLPRVVRQFGLIGLKVKQDILETMKKPAPKRRRKQSK